MAEVQVNEERNEVVVTGEPQPTESGGDGVGESGGGGGEAGGENLAIEQVRARVLGSLVQARKGLVGGNTQALWNMIGSLVELVAEDAEGRKALKAQFDLPRNFPNGLLGERVVNDLTTCVAESESGESVRSEEGEGRESVGLTVEEYVGQEIAALREDLNAFMVDFSLELRGAVEKDLEKKLKGLELSRGREEGKKKEGRKGKGRKRKGGKKGKGKGKEPVSDESVLESESSTGAPPSEESSESSTSSDWSRGDLSSESTSSSTEEESYEEEEKKGKRKKSGKGKKPSWAGKKAGEMSGKELVEAGKGLLRWLKKERKKMGKRSKAEYKTFKDTLPSLIDGVQSRKGRAKKRAKSALRATVKRMKELGNVILQIKVERVDGDEIATLFGKDAAKEVKARERKMETTKTNKGGAGAGNGNRFRQNQQRSYQTYGAGYSNNYNGAFYGFKGNNYGGQRRQQGRQGGGEGFPGECHRCGEWGHRASQCSKPKKCYICGSTQHLASRCNNPRQNQ